MKIKTLSALFLVLLVMGLTLMPVTQYTNQPTNDQSIELALKWKWYWPKYPIWPLPLPLPPIPVPV